MDSENNGCNPKINGNEIAFGENSNKIVVDELIRTYGKSIFTILSFGSVYFAHLFS
jgi:hypothetical protein